MSKAGGFYGALRGGLFGAYYGGGGAVVPDAAHGSLVPKNVLNGTLVKRTDLELAGTLTPSPT